MESLSIVQFKSREVKYFCSCCCCCCYKNHLTFKKKAVNTNLDFDIENKKKFKL